MSLPVYEDSTGYTFPAVYTFLYANADAYKVIPFTQQEMADALGISRETMNYYYRDFVDVNLIVRVHRGKFEVTVHPSKVDWDKVEPILRHLHKRHNKNFRQRTAEEYIETFKGEQEQHG